jgi:hypothetical protein
MAAFASSDPGGCGVLGLLRLGPLLNPSQVSRPCWRGSVEEPCACGLRLMPVKAAFLTLGMLSSVLLWR